MDHHGTESHRDGVAIRACGEDFGARRDDPRFVVTGAPDADATLAIIALAGLVEREDIPAGFPELVDRHDMAPIGLDLLTEEHGPVLLTFQQTPFKRGLSGFEASVECMVALIHNGLNAEGIRRALGTERSRQERAQKSLVSILEPGGRVRDLSEARETSVDATTPAVALVHGSVWGFDIWYRWAPIVVSYSSRLEKVTLGCVNAQRALELLGEGGLLTVYPEFGVGWGGRDAVGGSPRGVPLALKDAESTAQTLAILLGERLKR
jgi:hypothetical protein